MFSKAFKHSLNAGSLFQRSAKQFRTSQALNNKFNVYIDGKPTQVRARHL